jgi:hypothetical protein
VVPKGYYQDRKMSVAEVTAKGVSQKKEEEDQDYWFNHSRPMTKPKLTWREKRLAKEEDDGSGGSSGEEE